VNSASDGVAPSRRGDSESSRDLKDAEASQQDVALMLRVKEGDLEAFEELVTRHQHSVVGTAARMLGSGGEAEDIAQQVFVRIWKSAARYEPSAKFTTWLMTITRNLVFNELRRRRRTHLVSLETAEDEAPPHQFADQEALAPSEKLIDAELQQAIDTAIASLPEKQRLAVVLRRYESMSYEEIAKILATSVAAVKSILFRARAELKDKLQKYLE
jgi:RNA polymerase sigma-70 factor, ECF subfamily